MSEIQETLPHNTVLLSWLAQHFYHLFGIYVRIFKLLYAYTCVHVCTYVRVWSDDSEWFDILKSDLQSVWMAVLAGPLPAACFLPSIGHWIDSNQIRFFIIIMNQWMSEPTTVTLCIIYFLPLQIKGSVCEHACMFDVISLSLSLSSGRTGSLHAISSLTPRRNNPILWID